MQSPTSPRLLVAACALTGLVGGLSASTAVQMMSFKREAPAAVSAAPKFDGRTTVDTGRLAELEAKVASLQAEKRQETKHSNTEPTVGTARPSRAPPDRSAEAERKLLQNWEDKLSSHGSEPVDPEWAARAARAYERDLRDISAQVGFRLLKTDCRSSHCTSSLEFPSYDDAQKHFTALLNARYELNCSSEIVLPEPKHDHNGPYAATVLYTCEDS
jgi:hypothetical protein